MKHVAQSNQTGIIRSGRKGWVRGKHAGEEITGEEGFFRSSPVWILQGWKRASILFQGRYLWGIDQEEAKSEAHAEGRRCSESEGDHGQPRWYGISRNLPLLTGIKNVFTVVGGIKCRRDKTVVNIHDTIISQNNGGPTAMTNGRKASFPNWPRFF